MWQKKRLRIPQGLQPVTCSTVAAHPWVFGLGQEEPSGFYLSPPNAVDYLTSRLAGAAERQDVTVVMLTAPTLATFIGTLAQAASVLPIPALTQIHRRATTAASLMTSKMQIPAAPGGLPASVPLSIVTTRAAAGVQALQQGVTDAGIGGGIEDIGTALAAFSAQRATLLDEATNALAQLQAGSFSAWVLSATDSVQTAAALMRKDIPDTDAIFTLALMFVGADLAPLRAMVAEV
ncbi:hypothetical protein HZI30_05040 [Serratia fonticola]|uniref:hypothetical protein n=1 Tax=Serratia fonticola TaxID=47917 RepID=UPI0015C66EE3|nr:hypothetical protein [Serratia fonticola]NXZ86299.1 hypothetical protein [Serratia fonticola]